MKKIGVVVTTISDGNFLEKYKSAVLHSNATCEILFYVIGDKNTPEACKKNSEKISNENFTCKYFDIAEQEIFLKAINFPVRFIPYKSDNRRNVGYLKAVEDGCDVIISIDDDNFPVDNNFFTAHSIAGDKVEANVVDCENRWFNPLKFLVSKSKTENDIHIYPRGYPYTKKWEDASLVEYNKKISGQIGINVGLWTGDPDVDAITRLCTGCYSEARGDYFSTNKLYALDQQHLMPINTQNTSLCRAAIAAYYFVKMGYTINDMRMDRFGDIFSGYFVLLCNQSVGNIVTLGNPLVNQERNEHNLFKDLQVELPGILIIEDLIPFLEAGLPKTNSYSEAYESLIEQIKMFTSSKTKSSLWTANNLLFINEVTEIMSAWIRSYAIIS
jgi:reversibly glycosylated polypeptide